LSIQYPTQQSMQPYQTALCSMNDKEQLLHNRQLPKVLSQMNRGEKWVEHPAVCTHTHTMLLQSPKAAPTRNMITADRRHPQKTWGSTPKSCMALT
jgi:hypothetical protein